MSMDSVLPAASVGYAESLAVIGAPVPLHGVLSSPSGAARETALLILNSGLLHQVGACNASVELARSAAALGYRSLRFDGSGIGDSASRSTSENHEQRAVSETLEALHWLAQHTGTQRFVSVGLCSGAFASFNAALEEPRIEGVIQIAGFAYPNFKWKLHHYLPRIYSARSWKNRITRSLGGRVQWRKALPDAYLDTETSAGWSIPPQETVAAGYQRLTQRDVAMLNIMTGGESYWYNYQGQFKDNFPVLSQARFEEHHLPEASHIIAERDAQLSVRQLMLDWLTRHFKA
ncbi:MAG: hypothetical protein AAGG11_07090 [Pseudomonadota bacterium]